jgi:exodeoxyribonuclease X
MFIYLDTETTGKEPDDRLCQLAFKTDHEIVNELFNPGRKISIEAMAIHHITEKMVLNKPGCKNSAAYQKLKKLIQQEDNILVAHSAEYDMNMLRAEGLEPTRYICTLKLARFLDKDGVIPRHGLQYLRYYLGLDVEAKAHDALGDIIVLEALFKRLYKKFVMLFPDDPIEAMLKVTREPIMLVRMTFGKHKGERFSDLPLKYLQWLSTIELDEDTAYTVKCYLTKN